VRIGELDPVAIAYLTLVQSELSGADDGTKMVFIARWMEPTWSFRRTQWERLRPRRLGDGSTVIDCPTCLSVARLTADGHTYGCPVCGLHVRFDAGPHPPDS
jgi:hypothetical protein